MVLAKRTSKNQLTLPKAIVEATGPADDYEVTCEGDRIVLTPLRIGAADELLPPLRVVLDTNVLVTSLLFHQGRLSWIRHARKNFRAGRKGIAADRIFLDLAIGSAADVLVSGDADLLVLAGELEGLAILSPREFKD